MWYGNHISLTMDRMFKLFTWKDMIKLLQYKLNIRLKPDPKSL